MTHKAPNCWQRTNLGNIATIQTGIAKNSKNLINGIKVPFLRVANVQNGFLELNDLHDILLPAEKIARYKVESNDLLLVEGNGNPANLGRCAIWTGEITNCVHQNHLFVVRADDQKCNFRFLAEQIRSAKGRYYLLSCSKTSSGLATLNRSQLNDFPVLLPPLSEQKAIADLLFTWDSAIEKTDRLIAAKEKALKWMFGDLIAKPCPEGKWKEVRLSKLFESMTEKNSVGETNVLTTSAEHGLVSQTKYYKKDVSGKDLSKYYLLKKGDFAYNRSSSNGYPYGVIKRLDETEQGVLSTLYLCMRPAEDAEMNSDFYVHLFESGILNKKLRGICQEGARSHGLLNLSKSDYFTMKIPYPDIEIQNKVAEILNLAEKEIEIIKATLGRYKEQKRGLMQKLLTGE